MDLLSQFVQASASSASSALRLLKLVCAEPEPEEVHGQPKQYEPEADSAVLRMPWNRGAPAPSHGMGLAPDSLFTRSIDRWYATHHSGRVETATGPRTTEEWHEALSRDRHANLGVKTHHSIHQECPT